MNTYLQHFIYRFEQVVHPAGGKITPDKKKKRATKSSALPKATPDSQNIRDLFRKADGFRRNPAP